MAFVGASGCTSIHPYGGAHAALGGHHRVVLVEMPMSRDERMLRSQFAPDSPAESAQSREAIANAVATAEASALADMREALKEQPGLEIDDADSTAHAVEELALANPDVAITAEMAQRLHAMTGADDLVRFRITDYGATPKAWRKAFIAFEVTSTLAIAGIAYAYPKTRPLAGAYLIEETIEETVEGYAGFWALNEVGRPVRVEGELASLSDARQNWKGAATGLSDIRLARIFRKVSSEEQNAQRERATRHAVRRLVAKMVEGLPRADSGIRQ